MPGEDTTNMGAVTAHLRALSHVMELRILIVDDDELVRTHFGQQLEACAVKVTYAANGAEALAMLEKEPVPLVMVDWLMPVMDGIEFTETLRARGMTDIYIVMLTVRDASIDYERGYRAGVDDYLSKQVTDQDIFARIHAGPGFATFMLRRALRETQAALAEATSGKGGPA
jgi:CheY-like chemotaxis protein